ncbi:DUF805 domain-containing protein [Arthrobacter sp. UM1]|uniref:DUF805 domain-containing protein n=1 Tax=Arthrobacter sp. UM1 TaxID=2766776 RepID=UPI001CF678DD|nr:DUF805 domain-containing protein [Arthrobacter sp. UM1]MCB4208651.1 DUF805 domain-containing protein [Arthrobacter sp. UM1]
MTRSPVGGTPDNLDLPLYGAGPVQAVVRFFKRWLKFQGRSSRSEFWWSMLAQFLVNAVMTAAMFSLELALAGGSPREFMQGPAVFALTPFLLIHYALLIPCISMMVRRLQDAGLTGFLCLLLTVPFGALALLVMCCLPSKLEGERFDDPNAPGVRHLYAGTGTPSSF